ncbi:putative cysteine peptidase [Mycoplasma hafezii]|uniref:putative cysteine peptidase n=1 Tax=Mycoplasma hafezii TaxID=525886 RepID=UPI003CEA7938
MKKIFKKLLIFSSLVSTTAAVPLATISAKVETKFNNNIVFGSELLRVNRIDNKDHKIEFTKTITDLNGHKVFLVCFDNIYSIIDTNSLITLETRWDNLLEFENNQNLFYIPTIGIVEKINNLQYKSVIDETIFDYEQIKDFIVNIDNSKSQFIKVDEYKKRQLELNDFSSFYRSFFVFPIDPYERVTDAYIWRGSKETFASTPNVSNLTEHAWWWLSRDSEQRIGYDEPRTGGGWCCYHELANLLLYNEIFKYPGLFSDSEYKRFITNDQNTDNKIRYSSQIKQQTHNIKLILMKIVLT